MPPDSTDRFLIAPVRAARSFRRHSHSVSCQEPVRMSPGPLGTLGALGALGAPGPSGPSGPSKPSEPLVQLRQFLI